MAIPSNPPGFGDLLFSLRLQPPPNQDDWLRHLVEPEKAAVENGHKITLPAVVFWYKESGGIKLETLLKRLAGGLGAKGHPGDIASAEVILAIFACTSRSRKTVVEEFNKVFEFVTPCDLIQFLYLGHGKSFDWHFELGPFAVGNLQLEKLQAACSLAGSDFYERQFPFLRGAKFSVQREGKDVRVIEWPALSARHWQVTNQISPMMGPLLDDYFERISAVYFEEFFDEFMALQDQYCALGVPRFELQQIMLLSSFTHKVSVYLGIGGSPGFVSGGLGQISCNIGGAQYGIPCARRLIQSNFGIHEIPENALGKALRNYLRFLSMATRHIWDGREAEGFLHHVIALDLLLGSETSISAAVSSRAAALVCKAKQMTFDEACKKIGSFYKARSKYVHEGQEPEQRLVDELPGYTREIMFCLMRLCSKEAQPATWTSDQWLAEIDVVAARFRAGHENDDGSLAKIGAATENSVTFGKFETDFQSNW
jgi:hypothetical protein